MLPVSGGVNKVSVGFFNARSKGNVSLPFMESSESEREYNALGVKARGTSFFASNDKGMVSNIGLSYMAAFSNYITAYIDGDPYVNPENTLLWDFGVGAAYQIHPLRDMLIEMGAGLEYSIRSEVLSSIKTTYHIFSIGAYAELAYVVGSQLILCAGISISYPLGGSASVSSGDTTISKGSFQSNIFTFAPFVGYVFSY